jgi:3-isopropylmalate/(R)-2-methylmalate dehydratase large subunit
MTLAPSAARPPERAGAPSRAGEPQASGEPVGAMTLAQKLVARAAGMDYVTPGEIVTCQVDMAMFHDSSGPRRLKPMLETLGAAIWDKSRVVLVMDHYVPERDDESRRIVRIARDWAREQQLPHVYDSMGICHVVVPQHGHIRPGMFCVGGDSHSPTGGAFGAYMFGIGSTEMLGVLVTGEIWLRVPRTIRMQWGGRLAPGVCAKDMMLHMIGRFGMNGGEYQAVEFCGSGVTALGMNERMTLANMSAELGAQTGLIAPDEVTQAWLAGTTSKTGPKGRFSASNERFAQSNRAVAAINSIADHGNDTVLKTLRTDEAAIAGPHCTTHDFDSGALEPQVAAPHSPGNAHGVQELAGMAVDTAYIGACTGAKLDDMRFAARVLKGKRVDPRVRLLLAPASLQDQRAAEAEGTLQVLTDAGATLLASACGACAGYGQGFADGQTVISSTARNFKGRMGPASVQVYLGSAYTVAASAVCGRITDPRTMMD